jgi:hypothetical protein
VTPWDAIPLWGTGNTLADLFVVLAVLAAVLAGVLDTFRPRPP